MADPLERWLGIHLSISGRDIAAGGAQPAAGTSVTITIGPVGLPVGEPPSGSTLTATLSAARSADRCASLSLLSALPAAGSRPSETGAPASRQCPQLVGLARSWRHRADDFHGECGEWQPPLEPPYRMRVVRAEHHECLQRRWRQLAHEETHDERDRHNPCGNGELPGAPARARRASDLAEELAAHVGPHSRGRLHRRQPAAQQRPVVFPPIDARGARRRSASRHARSAGGRGRAACRARTPRPVDRAARFARSS